MQRRCGSHRLQLCAERDIHASGSWLGRQDGGRSEERGHRLQGRQVPIHGKFPGENESRDGRLCQGTRRQQHR